MNRRILIVEDNPISRKMLRVVLELDGFVVDEAPDARTALRLMEELQPDLVVQDLILPDMDGIELTRRLRALSGDRDVPIVALSGFSIRMQEAVASESAFSAFLMKPADPDHLLEVIRTQLPKQLLDADLGAGRSVLLVDDDLTLLKLGRLHLESYGFRVFVAAGGEAALEVARRERPDAVVSDILMRGMDGFQLCMAIRADPQLGHLPVFLISSQYGEPEDRVLATRVGADALFGRSPDYREVAEAVVRGLERGPTGSRASGDLEAARREHGDAVIRQLDRQVELNTSLAQRCSIQAAQLSLLGGIADALTRKSQVRLVLGDVLAACLDAAGISRGVLYLVEPGGSLLAHSSIGYGHSESDAVSTFFEHRELLDRSMREQIPITVPSEGVEPEVARRFLDRAGISTAHIVPLVHGNESLGALLLGSGISDLTSEDPVAFARAIGFHVVKSLKLADAFDRLAASEARYRSVVDHATCGVFSLQRNGTIEEANRLGAEILGVSRDALIGRSFLDFLSPSDRNYAAVRFLRRVGQGAELFTEITIERPDGRRVVAEFSPALVEAGGQHFVIAVATDVTERNSLREQAVLNDKLATVGTLAAGVAHEINNPIAFVLANLTFLQEEIDRVKASAEGGVPPELDAFLDQAREIVRESLGGTERVRDIVRGMKGFARVDDSEVASVDVNQILDAAANMVSHEIRYRARLEKDYQELPRLVGSPGKLTQVFVNLIVNAAHAIRPGSTEENTVRVRTSRDDERIRVEVSDTGSGIPPDVLPRIFDPFFTTKGPGVGTGLGLSICHEIVRNHGGHIRVDTQLGRGSTFFIWLPLQSGYVLPDEIEPGSFDLGPPARVLVVDDEPFLLRAVSRMLSSTHDVTVAEGGRAALEILSSGASFELMITDLMMPDVSGIELYRFVSEQHPELARQCLFMTGGAFAQDAQDFLKETDLPRISKPFTAEELAGMLGRVRDQRSPAR